MTDRPSTCDSGGAGAPDRLPATAFGERRPQQLVQVVVAERLQLGLPEERDRDLPEVRVGAERSRPAARSSGRRGPGRPSASRRRCPPPGRRTGSRSARDRRGRTGCRAHRSAPRWRGGHARSWPASPPPGCEAQSCPQWRRWHSTVEPAARPGQPSRSASVVAPAARAPAPASCTPATSSAGAVATPPAA